jgi:hypothetical protein
MVTEIPSLPEGVLGFEVSGTLTTEDYRETLAPAVAQAAKGGEIRLVIVIPTFEDIDPGAVWEDTKMGIDNWSAWTRVAFVTDIGWMTHALRWLGWMSPGEVKQFPIAERDAAITWAAG